MAGAPLRLRARPQASLPEGAQPGDPCTKVTSDLHPGKDRKVHHTRGRYQTDQDHREGACLADAVEHIRWRLWHAQVQRAWDLIGKTLTWLEGMAEAALTAAAKATALLRGLETYVSGQADLIIDYATAQRRDEPISTATTEGTVQWLLHRRMGTNQQMRWTPRGAHCMLKVRTAVANDTLAGDHAAAEPWTRRPFRTAA